MSTEMWRGTGVTSNFKGNGFVSHSVKEFQQNVNI